MRVLIGTLYSGENELDRCVDALKSQRFGDWEHFILENLPEKEAHDRLYGRFMESAGEFDLFLKLDADMILADDDKLGAAVALFEAAPPLDHAVFTVQDWMSNALIIGIHLYRNTVRWPSRTVELFTDLPPVVPGRRRYFVGRPPSPLAVHSPDPGPAQAFRYGLHRGRKAFQVGLDHAAPLHAIAHWRLLKRLWHHFETTRDQRLGLALLGVEHAIETRVAPAQCDYTNPRFSELLATCETMTPAEIHEQLRSSWNVLRRESRWLTTFTRHAVRGLLRRSA